MKSLFTQKHHEHLMRSLADNLAVDLDKEGCLAVVSETLCRVLEKDNPNFKRHVFMSGVNETTNSQPRSRRST